MDTHLQHPSLGLRQGDNASKASDDVRAAADYDQDTAVFIRGAFEAERRGNTLRKLLPCRSPFLWSQCVVGGWCDFWVLLASRPSKSLRGYVRILAEVSPRDINAYS